MSQILMAPSSLPEYIQRQSLWNPTAVTFPVCPSKLVTWEFIFHLFLPISLPEEKFASLERRFTGFGFVVLTSNNRTWGFPEKKKEVGWIEAKWKFENERNPIPPAAMYLLSPVMVRTFTCYCILLLLLWLKKKEIQRKREKRDYKKKKNGVEKWPK